MEQRYWSPEEDEILMMHVHKHGDRNWHLIKEDYPKLSRSSKSCWLRWQNELRPDLKKGPFTTEDEEFLIELQGRLGSKWAQMAKEHFPGRTGNDLKNLWNKLKRRGKQIDATNNGEQTPALVTEHSFPSASRRKTLLPPNASTFRDPSLYENPAAIVEHNEILHNSVDGCVLSQFDLWISDELIEETRLKKNAYLEENSNPISDGEIEALLERVRCNEHKTELSEAINYERPLAQDDYHFERESLNSTSLPENPAAIIESNESLDASVVGLEDKYFLSQQDLSMPYEPLEENYYPVANFSRSLTSHSCSERQKCDRNSTCPDAGVQNYEASDPVDMGSEWDFFNSSGVDQRTLAPNALTTFRGPSLCVCENPAPIIEHHEILANSEEEHVPAAQPEQFFCKYCELYDAINYPLPLAQNDHHLECKPKNSAAFIKNDEILDDLVADINPSREDELSSLGRDFYNEQLPLAQYGGQNLMLACFERDPRGLLNASKSNKKGSLWLNMTVSSTRNQETLHAVGLRASKRIKIQGGLPNAFETNKKEAAAVNVELLPIATMEEKHVLTEESPEQIWSDPSRTETFSGCNLAMELPSVQNKDFDGLWDL